jgi:hypothetical protein
MKIFLRNPFVLPLMLTPLVLTIPAVAQANRNGTPLKPLTAPPAAKSSPQKSVPQILLAVTVREKKHGQLITDLTKKDFQLSVDHKPLAIQSFEPASSLPLTIGLLVDTSGGQLVALADERAAAGRFLDHMLTVPNEHSFVIQFAHEVDLLADVSANKNTLHSALDQLGRPQSHDTTADEDNTGEHHFHVGGSDNLYDAIYLASDQMMKTQPDRKVLIVLTNGIDSGSKESLFSAIEAAQRSNSTVYAIYFKGEGKHGKHSLFPGQQRSGYPGGGYPGGGYPGRYPGGGYPGRFPGGGYPGGGYPGGNNPQPAGRPTEGSRTDGRKILAQICSETGGRMFEISHKMNFDQAFGAIAEELAAQYIIGFTPAKDDNYSGYHRVGLTEDRKNTIVQTRQGYYAGSD